MDAGRFTCASPALLARVRVALAPWAARIDRDAAISFARVEPIVGRMRAAFFGPDEPCPSIDLRMTPWQVRAGAPVTIGVPLAVLCDACQGRSEVFDEPCAACGASGLVVRFQPVRLRLPPRAGDGAPLDFEVTPAARTRAVMRLRVTIAP
jgi:hypothetical protein